MGIAGANPARRLSSLRPGRRCRSAGTTRVRLRPAFIVQPSGVRHMNAHNARSRRPRPWAIESLGLRQLVGSFFWRHAGGYRLWLACYIISTTSERGVTLAYHATACVERSGLIRPLGGASRSHRRNPQPADDCTPGHPLRAGQDFRLGAVAPLGLFVDRLLSLGASGWRGV